MGSGASSIVIPEEQTASGRKDAIEWLYFIRNALKNENLRLRMREFLSAKAGPSLSGEERNNVRLFVDLEVWSKLIRRAKILGEIEDLERRKEKTESVRAEMYNVIMKVTNLYVVTDAQFPIQLPREVRNSFGKLSISMSSQAAAAGLSESLSTSSSDSSTEGFLGGMSLDEMENLVNDTELNLLPSCRDLLNRFMKDDNNAHVVREAMINPLPKEIWTPHSSLAAPNSAPNVTPASALPTNLTEKTSSEKPPSPSQVRRTSTATFTPIATAAEMRILIVDDSYPMLKMLSFSLSKEGLEVVAVQNGEMALEMLKQKTFHAALIDLEMPNINGYELAFMYRKYELGTTLSPVAKPRESAQAQDEFIPYVDSITFADPAASTSKRLLLIGMSSNKSDVVEHKCREAGMDYFVEKPFTASAVMNIIKGGAH